MKINPSTPFQQEISFISRPSPKKQKTRPEKTKHLETRLQIGIQIGSLAGLRRQRYTTRREPPGAVESLFRDGGNFFRVKEHWRLT